MDILPKMPLFAPLAEDQVRDLVSYRGKNLPRGKGGRPRRGEDEIVRYERQQERALSSLVPDVAIARQHVFKLLDNLVQSGQWNRRNLLDILYPPPSISYPERLTDWAREYFLWFNQDRSPALQPTAALLVQAELDSRKRKIPPSRQEPHLFFCWRWNMPKQPPSSYELPLVLFEGSDTHFLKLQPEPSPTPYILATPWKGVQWDDTKWIVFEEGAACWQGEPTDEQLSQWISEEERMSLRSLTDGQAESLATQILRLIVTKQLLHDASSDILVQ